MKSIIVRRIVAAIAALLWAAGFAIATPQPSYAPSGELENPASGKGLHDDTVYFPAMRFPLEHGPAFLNSQVYRPGGSHSTGGGGQCAPQNYAYPWRDNFCEARSWSMPLCPSGTGHQGQDIRPATCKKDLHWAVAVEDGVIAQIGRYSVTLQTKSGTLYRYLHMNMKDLRVRVLERVTKGQRMGKVSNDFGDTATTIHLHFDIKDAITIGGKRQTVFMPPYASLKSAYVALPN